MKINYRQCCILVFMSMISLKFLALPSLLYRYSGNMSILVSLILMLIDAIYAVMIIGLIERSGHKNSYEFMRYCLGRVGAKIVLILLMFKFAIVIGEISKGLEFFVEENLYTDLHWLVFVLPIMILIGFMVYKGIRNIARVNEIFCWFIIVGIVYIGLKSVSGIEGDSLLPLMNKDMSSVFESAFRHVNWFGSSAFLLLLFGKIDFTDKKRVKLFVYIAIAISIVQFMHFIFYSLFQVTSPTHNFMLSDISQFSTEHSSIDELSWLIVALWIVAQAVQLALYSFCLEQTIMFTFNIRNSTLPILIVMIYILLWSVLGEYTINLERIFFSTPVAIISIIAQYIVPILLVIVYAIKRHLKPKSKLKKVNNYEEIKDNV